MTKITPVKTKQAKNKKYILVRYGKMNLLGLFEHRQTNIPKVDSHVVVKTSRGIELGHLVGGLCPYKAGHFKLSQSQIKKYFDDSQIEFSNKPAGRMVRFASPDDVNEARHLDKIAKQEAEYCTDLIKQLDLPMKIVDAEHVLGGERIIFYFMADGRVDFRELVKKLADDYQTRIEMRQIGSRDEAKMLGDVESCGQQCCCARFLKALKPVNMKMAKMQKATLDPAKISGFCGRLKCCLRYEDKTYNELKKLLPKRNSRVKTPHGEGKVEDAQILTQLVMVKYADGRKIAVAVEDVKVIDSPVVSKKKNEDSSGKDKRQTTKKQADNQ